MLTPDFRLRRSGAASAPARWGVSAPAGWGLRHRLGAWWWAAVCTTALTACGGGGGDGTSGGSPATGGTGSGGGAQTTAQPVNTEGRLLASNCFQCHGTGGMGGLERIRGGEVSEVREYRDLVNRLARSDIMAAHAQGYSDAQIAAIIQYLQQ